jgi:hypothetical protein
VHGSHMHAGVAKVVLGALYSCLDAQAYERYIGSDDWSIVAIILGDAGGLYPLYFCETDD